MLYNSDLYPTEIIDDDIFPDNIWEVLLDVGLIASIIGVSSHASSKIDALKEKFRDGYVGKDILNKIRAEITKEEDDYKL
jgi:hypothetical protein